MLRLYSLLLTALVAWGGGAQTPVARPVEDMVRAVRSGLQARESDEQIARAIEAIKLTDRLDDEVIEQLQTEGAGQLAIDKLERQRDISCNLPPPAVPLRLFESPVTPSAEEQSRVIELARAWTTQYMASLPNFLCEKEVSRHTKRKDQAPWQMKESLKWELGYADRKEYQKLVAINGRPTQRKTAHGWASSGEFGGIMSVIFRPNPEAKLQWSRWSNLRGRPVQVFSYYVEQKQAGFLLAASGWITSRRAFAGLRGSVYIDGETGHIMRITYDADEIPSGFPVLRTHEVVDYSEVQIGGEKFLLPVRSTGQYVTTKGVIGRSVMEFTNYRKFTSEVKIEFEKQ
jgi:hypothetical protein